MDLIELPGRIENNKFISDKSCVTLVVHRDEIRTALAEVKEHMAEDLRQLKKWFKEDETAYLGYLIKYDRIMRRIDYEFQKVIQE